MKVILLVLTSLWSFNNVLYMCIVYYNDTVIKKRFKDIVPVTRKVVSCAIPKATDISPMAC